MKLDCYKLSIRDVCWLYRHRVLELEPPYQRRPAWRTRQRHELLNSIFNGIPIPAVILYRTSAGGRRDILEVMDGKQRLETVLHFRYGKIIPDEGRLGFYLRNESKRREWHYFADLKGSRNGITLKKFFDYKIPVIEYRGDLEGLNGQKIAQWEVFSKINSTGSKLTKNELRHANSGPLFDAGTSLESRWYRRMVDDWRVFSKAEADRYQYHEFMLEVLTIFLHGRISHKRERLDHFMRAPVSASEIARAEHRVNRCFKWIRAILKDEGVRRTRFSKKADLYSLCGVLAELIEDRAVTTNAKANRVARTALINLSVQISKIDPKVVRYSLGHPIRARKQLAAYVVATREATDQLSRRERRHQLLKSILFPIFKKRLAHKRLFPRSQKNALWWAARPKKERITCPNPFDRDDCLGRMRFNECEVDHRLSYSRGGQTDLHNAQLLCKVCNSSKGGR